MSYQCQLCYGSMHVIGIPCPNCRGKGYRLIIAGGRNYTLTHRDYVRLVQLLELPIIEVVSGGARGVDGQGERWAGFHDIPVRRFPANWEEHGRKAGPLRNREMAEYADAVILFPGGRGTDSMFHEATRAGLKVFDYRHQT